METRVRFVRFVVPVVNDETRRATGMFQVRDLWPRRQVPVVSRRRVAEAFDWFNEHLPVPPVVKTQRDALSWFRREPGAPAAPEAFEPLRRAFLLASHLRRVGVRVETVQCADPGRILYEDRWQVVAVPKSETVTGKARDVEVLTLVAR